MRTIQASDAKTQFLRILNDVERGETFRILRRGKTVAHIVPPQAENEQTIIDEAIHEIQEIGKRTKPVSLQEIFAARDEGRL